MDNELLKAEKRSFARSDVSKGPPVVARHLAVLHMSSVDPGLISDSSLNSFTSALLSAKLSNSDAHKEAKMQVRLINKAYKSRKRILILEIPAKDSMFIFLWSSSRLIGQERQTVTSESPLDGIDEHLRTSPDGSRGAISKELAQNFNFDIPTSQSLAALLHADELFSDGLIKPVFAGPSKIWDASTSGLITVLPGSSFSSGNVIPVFQGHYRLFSKWRISFKNNFLKCFGYLRSHCHNIGSSRKGSSRVDGIDRREQEVKSWSSSPQASPPPSAKYSVGVGDWYDTENSIYEAILHCKRSIEK